MSCTLCDLPTPDPPVTDEAVAGEFCCQGCLAVARTLDDPAGADAGDAARSLGSGEGDEGGDEGSKGRAGDTPTDGDGVDEIDGEEAFLSVTGMHCATCEAFLEARATSHEGVRAAAASYPTETIKLTYDPEAIDAEALPDVVDAPGYDASPRSVDDDRAHSRSVGRLLVGGFFGMMTMLWYVLFLYPAYLGVPADSLLVDPSGAAGSYLRWNVWLMATIVLSYTGYPLFRGAYVSLRAGHPNMDLLVALAAGAAYAYSTGVTLAGGFEVYFDVAIVVVLAVTIGNHFEDRIKRRAAGRLADLTADRVDEARRRTSDGTETVPLDALDPGDEVVVKPGERVPVDGPIVEGAGVLDESLVTGESQPVRRDDSDDAIGGSVLRDGRLVVAVGAEASSTLDRVVRVLWDVQSSRPGAQRLVDRIAAVFVPLVFVLALVATLGHLLAGATSEAALLIGLSVLIVSCPCALGLATPLAIARGVRESLDRGIVVTDGATFEAAHEANVVAFDKTGTLTTGEMRVSDVVGDERVLARAAALEQYADHPVAKAIETAGDGRSGATADQRAGMDTDERAASAAEDRSTTVEDFERIAGEGVAGTVDGVEVLAGRTALFAEREWEIPDRYADRATAALAAGSVPVLVGWDGAVHGVIVAGDEPRPEWEGVVDDLASDHRVVVLTGDDASTERFQDHPGIDEVFAGLPPEGKTEVVRRLGADGTVAMVGDGVNDAPALAAADVGIALDHTALAADAADAVITTDDLTAVPEVFALTSATNSRIRQNLGWAFLYNAIAVPLAVAGLLNPLFAAGAMATSSLLVVGNSSRQLLGEQEQVEELQDVEDDEDTGSAAVGTGESATDGPLTDGDQPVDPHSSTKVGRDADVSVGQDEVVEW